jgi:hypothetical protein
LSQFARQQENKEEDVYPPRGVMMFDCHRRTLVLWVRLSLLDKLANTLEKQATRKP